MYSTSIFINMYYTRVVLDCGKVFKSHTSLISPDVKSTIGTAPWNVAIYKKKLNNTNYYELICGGSLISSNLVISGKSK